MAWLIGVGILGLLVWMLAMFAWALCVAAGRADEASDRALQRMREEEQ